MPSVSPPRLHQFQPALLTSKAMAFRRGEYSTECSRLEVNLRSPVLQDDKIPPTRMMTGEAGADRRAECRFDSGWYIRFSVVSVPIIAWRAGPSAIHWSFAISLQMTTSLLRLATVTSRQTVSSYVRSLCNRLIATNGMFG